MVILIIVLALALALAVEQQVYGSSEFTGSPTKCRKLPPMMWRLMHGTTAHPLGTNFYPGMQVIHQGLGPRMSVSSYDTA